MTSEYSGVRPFVPQLLPICGQKGLSGWITEHLHLNYLVNVKKNLPGLSQALANQKLGGRDEELEFLAKVLANASTRQGLRITSLDPSEPLAEPLWTWHVSEKSAAVLSH